MGVTTTNNKPLNPRGNDQSPLAFNRAKLFSGKALDFDGVNDVVNITTDDIDLQEFSVVQYVNLGATATSKIFYSNYAASGNVGFATGISDSTANVPKFYTKGTSSDTLFGSFALNAGEWYQIVATYDGATKKIYVNGVLDTSVAFSDTIVYTNATNQIGALSGGTAQALDGQLSNVKVFNTALTAAQVADIYNNPEKVVPTGVDNTALKLWLPMQEGAGTTAYDGAPDALGSEEVTNGDFATDSDWTKVQSTISNGKATITSPDGSYAGVYQNFLTIGKTYSYSIDVSAVTNGVAIFSGSSLSRLMTSPGNYKGTFVATNIRLEIKRNADDIMSAEIDNVSVKELTNFGTISGATWTHGIGAPVAQTSVIDWNKASDGTNEVLVPQGLTSGRDLLGNLFENVRKQGALNLDGNSWAEVHDNASLDITSAISLEAWVYWDGAQADKGIIGKWRGSDNLRGYLLYVQSLTEARFFVSSNGVDSYNVATSTTILNGWNHIVGISDGSKIKIYLNGIFENEVSASTIFSSSLPLEIGRFKTDSNAAYENEIAQPRIYNRALTAEEVARNYNNAKSIYTNS